ncbi:hypothetical protein PanWU01x14_347890 [Parasponia andersonii]|uniref:Uncharacterized protein n=1 Tax=Parasponia andersonii TaxID=3476 RepID=A0A2P5ABW9_PARAD|nr:hypothetical protein PanWU01x14_347890 [Parasponia andersonii]
MGRESHGYPTTTHVVHSSIALLQERFRELQRVKEMREERELLRMLAEPHNSTFYKQFNTTQYYKPATKLAFHHDMMFQQRSTAPQVSLSLWPTFQNSSEEQYYYCSSFVESPLLMKTWPKVDAPSFEACLNKSQDSVVDHESDVDTSLHL